MITNEKIITRFSELEAKMYTIEIDDLHDDVDRQDWQEWSNGVINLFKVCFGELSDYYKNFRRIYDHFNYTKSFLDSGIGIFLSAKEDYDNNFYESLEKQISGEIFGNFVVLARSALSEQFKDVAAVLASAALEDALKKYALKNGLDVNDKGMQEVVNALKTKGLVNGAQKSLLDTMPKIRDYAMHANWEKIKIEKICSRRYSWTS